MIRFFVSSTFNDMMGERDLIEREILSRLKKMSKDYGKNVRIIDLRWGIDTNDTGIAVEECLNAMDDCNVFLCLLGDYYGDESQGQEMIRRIWQSKVGGDIEIPGGAYDISVLQLEIEYALYKAENNDMNLIFCFRNLSNSEGKGSTSVDESWNKLSKLKKRIKENAASNHKMAVIDYNALRKQDDDGSGRQIFNSTDLQTKLLNHMADVINRGGIKPLHWTDQEQLISIAAQKDLLDRFIGREELCNDIVNKIISADSNMFHISGEPACGKSSITAKVFQKLAESEQCRCFYVACNKGERSKSYLDVLLQILYFMCNLPECSKRGVSGKQLDEYYTIEKAKTTLHKFIDFYNKSETKNTIFIVLDEIDRTTDYDGEAMEYFSSSSQGKVKFVLSGDFEKGKKNVEYFNIGKLDDKDVGKIASATMQHIEKDFEELLKVIHIKKQSNNPLYLLMLINAIKLKGRKNVSGKNNNKIYRMYHDMVEKLPNTLEELCVSYIEMVANETLNNKLWKDVIGLIAISGDGVDEEALLTMIKGLDRDALESFLLNLNDILFEGSQGKYQFTNHSIIESVNRWLMDHEKLFDSYRKRFFDYLHFFYLDDKQGQRIDYLHDAFNVAYNEKCTDLAIAIMKRINRYAAGDSYEERQIVRNAVKEIGAIIEHKDAGMAWFHQLIEKDLQEVMTFVTLSMEYKVSAELERRYPAKFLADAMWNALELVTEEDFCEYLERLKTPVDKRAFVSCCAQYVGVHDDISRQREALQQELPVYEYLISVQGDYWKTSYKNKEEMLENANLVFYSNNKLISEATRKKGSVESYIMAISTDLMQWFDKTVDKDPLFEKHSVRAAFYNNIGQHYNAVKDYKNALDSRKKSLELKANGLFEDLSVKESERQLFDGLLSLEKIDILQHKEYWEKFYKEYEEEINVAKEKNSVKAKKDRIIRRNKWNGIAVSYRTIATDCYYLPEIDKANGEAYLDVGREAHSLCLTMQEKPVMQEVGKERIVTKIRLLGLNIRRFMMYEKGDLMKLFDDAVSLKNDVIEFCKEDKTEQNNLKRNIETLIECFSVNDVHIKELKRLVRELEGDIAEFI